MFRKLATANREQFKPFPLNKENNHINLYLQILKLYSLALATYQIQVSLSLATEFESVICLLVNFKFSTHVVANYSPANPTFGLCTAKFLASVKSTIFRL